MADAKTVTRWRVKRIMLPFPEGLGLLPVFRWVAFEQDINEPILHMKVGEVHYFDTWDFAFTYALDSCTKQRMLRREDGWDNVG